MAYYADVNNCEGKFSLHHVQEQWRLLILLIHVWLLYKCSLPSLVVDDMSSVTSNIYNYNKQTIIMIIVYIL